MKKGTVIGLLLAVASLILLGLLACYLTFQNRDTLFSDGATKTESEADAALCALYESETEPAQPADHKDTKESEETSYIWVGDSRTLGMKEAMQNQDIYIGASGEGYRWLSETGITQLEEAIRNDPKLPVIFNCGVNDYDNLSLYLKLYESLLDEYPDTEFYFLSVNPIEPTLCKNITNENITDFNNQLREAFPDTYLDSFTYLMVNETVPIDGIHYSKEDYRLIYEFAVQQIQKKKK